MNFIFALFVLLVSSSEPQIFFYNGKTVTEINTLTMPNVGSETFQLLVNSPYELRSASVDSSEVGLRLPGKDIVKQLKFSEGSLLRKGRWYMISWETELKVGSKQHTVYLKTRFGKIYKKHFTINVEGNKKQEKPAGENR